ncbi:hypothetical protein [Arthrobacter antibioticus]|uniref:hypothetical protein n=1 Tax=Arthrobacter sp. H35-MC1 TaxID=3046203 RepID=UPI0024BBBFED|nr:hypothetical protein [Arthrobacter sp. H35-MC1]MDJ0317857.1 hypothetical protein [Arthrobacter sp. H35-MC1]
MRTYDMTPNGERPQDPQTLATILRRLKLNLPKDITDGPPTTHAIGASQLIEKVLPYADHMAAAARAVLNGESPAQHLALAAAENMRIPLAQAIVELGSQTYVDKLNTNADNIIKALRAEIFNPAIGQLTALIDNAPHASWDLDTALAEGDYKQAQIIKDNADIITRLEQTEKARRILHSGAFTGDAAWTQEPGSIDKTGEPNPKKLSWWATLIRDGYNPIFPTVSEWQKLHNSTAHADYRASQEVTVEVFQLGTELHN